MDQWVYMNAVIAAEEGQYIMPFANGAKLVGLDAIMNYWAAYGWELVTLVPSKYKQKANHGTYQVTYYPDLDAVQFIATFKGRQGTPQPGYQPAQPRISGPLKFPQE